MVASQGSEKNRDPDSFRDIGFGKYIEFPLRKSSDRIFKIISKKIGGLFLGSSLGAEKSSFWTFLAHFDPLLAIFSWFGVVLGPFWALEGPQNTAEPPRIVKNRSKFNTNSI